MYCKMGEGRENHLERSGKWESQMNKEMGLHLEVEEEVNCAEAAQK